MLLVGQRPSQSAACASAAMAKISSARRAWRH